MNISKIRQVGNSQTVTLPAAYRRKLGWVRGDHVYFELKEQSIIIRRIVDDTNEGRQRRATG